ncbi:MAG: hypothetical protein R3F62_16955 [Planctomycetota bacterium]
MAGVALAGGGSTKQARKDLHEGWDQERKGQAVNLQPLKDAFLKALKKDRTKRLEQLSDARLLRAERRWWRLKGRVERALQRGDRELAESLLRDAGESLRGIHLEGASVKDWKRQVAAIEEDLEKPDKSYVAQQTLDRTTFEEARYTRGSESFAHRVGVGGFGDTVDARLAVVRFDRPIALRAGVRFGALRSEREFRGATRAEQRTLRSNLGAYVGLSVDCAIVPFEVGLYVRGYERLDSRFQATGSAREKAREEDFGDVQVGVKVPIPLDDLGLTRAGSISLYGLGSIPTGGTVRQDAWAEFGAAVAVHPWRDALQLHLNLAAVTREHGAVAFRYRLAAALAADLNRDGDAVLRVHVGAQGLQYEGRPSSDVDLTAGVQVAFFQRVSLEVQAFYRVSHSGFLSTDERRGFRTRGLAERHLDEDDYGVEVSLGVFFF